MSEAEGSLSMELENHHMLYIFQYQEQAMSLKIYLPIVLENIQYLY